MALKKAIFSQFDMGEKLRSYLDPDTKFSANRCVRSMESAKRYYWKLLPSKYTSYEHEARVQWAMTHFRSLACGPAMEYYEKVLRKEFKHVWEDGRQQCDAVSVTK